MSAAIRAFRYGTGVSARSARSPCLLVEEYISDIRSAHVPLTTCQSAAAQDAPGCTEGRSLFLDGVFVRDDDGVLEFHELDDPSPEQVAEVAERTARRVVKLLQKAGKSLDSEFRTTRRKISRTDSLRLNTFT